MPGHCLYIAKEKNNIHHKGGLKTVFMKAVMIVFNQALTEKVEFMLDKLEIRGFTRWENIQGRGTKTGNPRMGTHTWPEMNSSILTIVEPEKMELLLNGIKKIDSINQEVGIKGFVWNIETFI